MANPFSIQRYIYVSGLVLGVSGILWGGILSFGVLGGYFPLFPAVPSFFFLVGVLSFYYMRKIITGENRKRFAAHFMLLTVAKLLLDVLFVAGALWLVGAEHRMALVLVALFCYLLSLLLSVRYLI